MFLLVLALCCRSTCQFRGNSENSNHMLSATSHIGLEFLTKFLNMSKLQNRLILLYQSLPLATVILFRNGPFYEFVKQTCRPEPEQITTVISGQDLENQLNHSESNEESDFDILPYLTNFKPSSVDAERLFSLGRLSKNYLQSRMSPQTHERNVFIAKNKPMFN